MLVDVDSPVGARAGWVLIHPSQHPYYIPPKYQPHSHSPYISNVARNLKFPGTSSSYVGSSTICHWKIDLLDLLWISCDRPRSSFFDRTNNIFPLRIAAFPLLHTFHGSSELQMRRCPNSRSYITFPTPMLETQNLKAQAPRRLTKPTDSDTSVCRYPKVSR